MPPRQGVVLRENADEDRKSGVAWCYAAGKHVAVHALSKLWIRYFRAAGEQVVDDHLVGAQATSLDGA